MAALYWLQRGETAIMWDALTTILIIACPCALLLSSTFTNGNVLRVLSKNRFYLRHPSVIADMAEINHIVFDKTGTITQSKKLKVQYKGKTLSQQNKVLLSSLLAQSTHPLSKAVRNYLNVQTTIPVLHFKDITGQEIEGWIDETYVKIGSKDFVEGEAAIRKSGSVVSIKIEHEIIGEFTISNIYRLGLEDMITSIKQQYTISILSGDNDAEEANLRELLKGEGEILFNHSPEEKLEYIKYLRQVKGLKVMMIGDGLNDAGALKQSNVGIAISEENNNFTPASDGIFDASGFGNLHRLLQFARYGRNIILASFAVSILYNIIGLYFAVQGLLAPVIAAILMPASSISIILLTFGMSEWKAKKMGLRS